MVVVVIEIRRVVLNHVSMYISKVGVSHKLCSKVCFLALKVNVDGFRALIVYICVTTKHLSIMAHLADLLKRVFFKM